MKKQRVSATWLVVLVAGMTLTTAKNVISAEDQPAVKPNNASCTVVKTAAGRESIAA